MNVFYHKNFHSNSFKRKSRQIWLWFHRTISDWVSYHKTEWVRFYSHNLLVNGNNTGPPRVYGNRLTAYQTITSRYSTCILTLILPHLNTKSLAIKAFDYPFRYKVSRLLPAKLHTQRDASAETNPPAGLSSIHSPILDRVWYHAPWWQHYRRYRRCGQLLFGHLPW